MQLLIFIIVKFFESNQDIAKNERNTSTEIFYDLTIRGFVLRKLDALEINCTSGLLY